MTICCAIKTYAVIVLREGRKKTPFLPRLKQASLLFTYIGAMVASDDSVIALLRKSYSSRVSREALRCRFEQWCRATHRETAAKLVNAVQNACYLKTVGPCFRAWSRRAALSAIYTAQARVKASNHFLRMYYHRWLRASRRAKHNRIATDAVANQYKIAFFARERAADLMQRIKRRETLRSCFRRFLVHWQKMKILRDREGTEEERHELMVRVARLERELAGRRISHEAAMQIIRVNH